MRILAPMLQSIVKKSGAMVGVAVLVLSFVVAFPAQSTHAAAVGSLYSYTFADATGTIANGAVANANVSLTLYGFWSATSTGVLFAGNTIDQQSVGYAKPASGATLSVPTTQAPGAAILFRYQAPASGCFSDSPNMTQIGKFAANTTQIKLQLSNCGKSTTNVFPQCRMAGSKTPSSVLPVTGSQSLVDGQLYLVQCVKSPDPTSGSASVQLKTTRVDSVLGNEITTNIFSVAKTGSMSSTQYLSVANKYPMASQASNTDQFVGEVLNVAYCANASTAAALACLDEEIGL